ncbi:DNA polymerase IV [Acidisarcina polymorpha]|uniref:DNA polymerase IV n=1 Tax=Acidisarcina polymorpha TaxID=2211140 RepID=A0A2Z5G6L9_9BACT|nr:DNA polymerase [Acidisarcina polymorpha]AXC14285.1 DNA polymerase IV [Acidisarcina polymorpha]
MNQLPQSAIDGPRLAWLFLDLNSYFASVEQELQPRLRARPVAVVPLFADTTCCIAASYEAKAFGVRTGTTVADAKRMCPGIELIEARHEIYVDYHHRIIEAVETCVPITAVMSIDEMACRLIGREQPLLAALDLARRVKLAVRERAGSTLKCSVGLAQNRYLAKIASDMEKPDGLVALTPDILEAALLGLKPRDLPGIGARMEKRLHECGIRTMQQLLKLGREEMNSVWGGIGGEKLWHWLRGQDFNDPALEHQKSISQSHMLSPELRTLEGTYAVLHKLLHKAAMRLRSARLWTTHLTLEIKYAVPKAVATKQHLSGIPQSAWAKGTSLIECQDNLTLIEALQKLWAQRPQGAGFEKPFYAGIALGNLVPNHLHTLNLFSGLEEESRRTRITTTMDSLNHKYGTNTVMAASMLLAGAAAPTRIAFTSIPELF